MQNTTLKTQLSNDLKNFENEKSEIQEEKDQIKKQYQKELS